MIEEITYLGTIIRVDSGTVEIEISDEIPSSAPIINGRLYKIGQIGSFVKIPIGNITIYGIVSAVSNTPQNLEESVIKELIGSRYLTVQLVGEKIGDGEFQTGIGTYPTISDEVHIVIEDDLFDIYGQSDEGYIEIGKHSGSDNLGVNINVQKLILRHCAILGSTGSGKSNTTVAILKALHDSFSGSRIVLIDPHGEYASAFPHAKVFKIGDKKNPLYIPFWLMNFDELAFFLVGSKPSDDQRTEYREFRELITKLKKENHELLAGNVNKDFITADSPIPFNIRKIWHEMNWWINATFSNAAINDQTKENACEIEKGNADNLLPAKFTPYEMGSNAPYKSKHQIFYSYEKKLLARLKDSRYDFMFHPGEYKNENGKKDLHNLLHEWIGNSERMTILDLSGVPFEILDISVGLITRFIYDSMFWGRAYPFTGKNRPIILAFEEAHTYLKKSEYNNFALNAVEKIFKEGRKFGVGALVISQRPAEISETILAQIGTFISLRLTNSADQSTINSSAPDNMSSLISLLPSLRIGEAVIVGESIKIPTRVRIPLQSPRPTSEDPDVVKSWKKTFNEDSDKYKDLATKIREQKF